MKTHEFTRCKETNKISFSSEAQALRRLERYEDIERVYYCEHCTGYHLTSISEESAVKYGIIEKEKQPKTISSKMLKKALNKLKNKL